MPSLLGGSCDMSVVYNKNLLPDGEMHKVLPDKGNSASVVGSSKCPCPEGLVGWECRGCDSLSQTHPLCLGWKGKKEGECQEGQDKSKSLGIGFACTSIWSCCWLYFYPGRTAFSPKELLSSASKSRIWLLLLGSLQLQAEALRLMRDPFNPYRYVVISSQG